MIGYHAPVSTITFKVDQPCPLPTGLCIRLCCRYLRALEMSYRPTG